MAKTESTEKKWGSYGVGYVILRHLFHQDGRNQDDMVAPFEVSQPGIARVVGISRAHAAIELKRLAEKHCVEWALRHVPETTGRRARRKTYRIARAGIVRLVALEGGETCEHLQNLVPPRTQNA